MSNLWDILIFDKNGLYYSIGFFLLLLLFYFLNQKLSPKFVVPLNNISFIRKILYKLLIILICLIILILPLNISIIGGKNFVIEKTVNIQVLYDVSLSMSAKDIKPDRFNGAKSAVENLIKNLNLYNISIITFSGIPFIWSPFSDDTKAIASKINSMKLSDFPPTMNFVGTAIGDALMLGISNLETSAQNKSLPGILILITDGDSNKGSDPISGAQIALKKNIPIYTLAIGQEDYIVGYDYYNTAVTTKINIPLLQEISQISKGKFYRVLSEKDFKGIFQEISKIIKSQERKKIFYEYIQLNYYLYIILFVFLLLYIFTKLYIIKSLVIKSKTNDSNN